MAINNNDCSSFVYNMGFECACAYVCDTNHFTVYRVIDKR